jgi:RHH-type proline utilization regulon transcriptional repressor/proline dehydrogenase/delta 1-pyrroline-5-carboxylate dehydrogenase
MSRPTFLTPDPALEAAVQREGQKLFALMDGVGSPAALSKRGIYGRLMEWSMKDAAFKTQLFRFVDVRRDRAALA